MKILHRHTGETLLDSILPDGPDLYVTDEYTAELCAAYLYDVKCCVSAEDVAKFITENMEATR